MELRTYWKILIRRWWLVVVPVVIMAAYVAVTYAPPATNYQAVMRFAAGTEPAGLSEDYDRYYPWLTSEYIANGLADVAETGVFAQAVAARLKNSGYDLRPGDVQGSIVTDNAQSILIVYLTWSNAEQCAAIADAVANELIANSATYYPQLKDVQPAVRLLDTPTPNPIPPGLRTQLMGPAIKIGLALSVGAALAFLWHYLDPTIHEIEELEDLGWEVLARIPRQRKS